MIWHWDLHKRKPTGGKKTPYRGKRKFEQGCLPAETAVGEDYRVVSRVRGGNLKVKLFKGGVAQVTDPKTGSTRSVKILKVVRNPSNIDYNRRGIITKGALIETEAGLARVTSRPGQHGVINAVLVEGGKKAA